MENARKNLKVSAILVLIFAGLSLIRTICDMIFLDPSKVTVPEGSPENIVLIAKFVIIGIALVVLLPQVYVGVKGLKLASNPGPAKACIVWATILFVISILSIISPIAGLIKHEFIGSNVSALLDAVVDILIYFEFIKYAKTVSQGE